LTLLLMRLAFSRLRREKARSFAGGKTAANLPVETGIFPAALPPPRRALTPPFHPYHVIFRHTGKPPGGLLSVALSVEKREGPQGGPPRFPPGNYPASCPAEPGLSSARLPGGRRAAAVWFIVKNQTSSKSIFTFSSSLSSSSNSSSSISSVSSNAPASSLSKNTSSPSADSS